MSYKVGVYGGGTGNTEDDPCYSGVRFGTWEEAGQYGADLLMRWTQPDAYIVSKSDDAVNAAYDVERGKVTHFHIEARS